MTGGALIAISSCRISKLDYNSEMAVLLFLLFGYPIQFRISSLSNLLHFDFF